MHSLLAHSPRGHVSDYPTRAAPAAGIQITQMAETEQINEILTFKPLLKTVIWGGGRIARFKGLASAPSSVGESWEISAMPGHVSVVDGGAYDGMPLDELSRRLGPSLLGSEVVARTGLDFPLLVKIIDAHRNLSVQVHPGADMARECHGCRNGKSEMWYVIDADADAEIICGLRRRLTPESFDECVANGTILDAVRIHRARKGQFYYIPAGTIHSAGAGNFIAEIQQPSDVTYRVYDYGRVDSEGRPRALHTAEARGALDYTFPSGVEPMGRICDASADRVVESPYFNIDYLQLDGTSQRRFVSDGSAFTVLMVVEGEADVVYDGGTRRLCAGTTALVPASMPAFTVGGCSKVLRITT